MDDLSEIALQDLHSIVEKLEYPQLVAEQAFLQFTDYSKKTKYFISREKLSSILKCSILIIAKTHKHRGTQLNSSLQFILQDSFEKIDEIILVLKEWVTFGQIFEEVRVELKNIIEQFSFMLAVSSKFDKVFRSFGFHEQTLAERNYNRQLKQLCWLLVIISKYLLYFLQIRNLPPNSQFGINLALNEHVFIIFSIRKKQSEQQAVIETTLYIIAVYQFLLSSVQRYTSGTFLEENKGNEKQALLKYFSVQDTESYEIIAGKFVNALREIFDDNALQHEGDIFQIFSPQKIEDNVMNLSTYYKETIMKEYDEQYFIFEKKSSSISPLSFTPFSRQGSNNKQAAPFPSEKYGQSTSQGEIKQESSRGNGRLTSQRFLNYDSQDSQGAEKKTIAEFKFSSPGQSTSPYRQARGVATPITNAMEMYNWLHSRKNILSCSTGTIAIELNKKVEGLDKWLEKNVLNLIEFEERETAILTGKDDFQLESRIKEQRIVQISSLFYRILNDYIIEEKSASDLVKKGVLVCACESVYFILNVKSMFFKKVVAFIEIPWFSLWKIMDFFMKLDQSMPLSLKAHILDLESNVVTYYSWREESQLLTFVKAYIEDSEKAKKMLEDRQEGYAIEVISMKSQIVVYDCYFVQKFFRMLLHQCAYSINQICNSMKLTEIVSEAVWRMMKHILGNQSDLLIGRHLDQLILCSVYVMCKIFKTETQFRQILNKYEVINYNVGFWKYLFEQELNQHNKQMMRELIYDFQITQDKRDTIVEYYNCIFLVSIKKAALSIAKSLSQDQLGDFGSPKSHKNSSISSKNPAISTPVFASPLKQMLPSEVCKPISKLPSHMTPQTQMLYAYNESPLLKENLIGQQNYKNMNSKKMINFDAELKEGKGGVNQKKEKQQGDSSAFAKYLKHGMDSIQESKQENSNSNLQTNKFRKASETSTLVKRDLVGQRLFLKTEEDKYESNNYSNISTPKIPSSSISQQQPNAQDNSQNNISSSSSNNNNNSNVYLQDSLKHFSKQSQYQNGSTFKQSTPQLLQNAFIQQQRVNSPNGKPLQQISQLRINSWQNQNQVRQPIQFGDYKKKL